MSEEKNKIFAAFREGAGKEIWEKFSAKFKEFKASLNLAAPAAPAAPVALKTMKTKDGLMTIHIAGDAPAVGVAVMDNTTGTHAPLADGEYVLEDGTAIKVGAGVIAEVMPAAPPTPPIDQAAAVQQAQATLRAEFAAQKIDLAKQIRAEFAAEISELKKSLEDQNLMLKECVNFNAMLTETPAPEKKKEKLEVDYSKLTPVERYRLDKYGKLD